MNRIRQCVLIYVLVCAVVVCGTKLYAKEASVPLHAMSAVVIDGETGRVLYGKDEYTVRPMASTTKIMTLILALEYGQLDEYVTVSNYASKMPQVKLGIREGEQYLLKDLLYSMMLESHNDSAVAVAECVAGSTEKFADMMNQRAKEIGMTSTYFITPNGLDAQDGQREHSTTAYDLALLMRYCTMQSEQRELFLSICQTRQYDFWDYSQTRHFSVSNKNALLDQMDGVLAGKTGFTGKAGYCYVTAVRRGENTYIVALLACGWPNNRSYKWADTKNLISYVEESYEKKTVFDAPYREKSITIENATMDTVKTYTKEGCSALLCQDDKVSLKGNIYQHMTLPIYPGDAVGSVDVYVNDVLVKSVTLYAEDYIEEMNFKYYLRNVWNSFFF